MINEMIKINDKLPMPVIESYRVLMSNIMFANIDNKIKSIVLTSCNPFEGKSVTSINLAITMARSKLKVIYVDADFRKPVLKKGHLMKASNVGLTNVISGKNKLSDVVYSSSIDNFHYLSSGTKPPNPIEIIKSKKFRNIIYQLREEYDYIIIDTPPIANMIDAALISSFSDASIFLVRSRAIKTHLAKRSIEQLKKANSNILGIIVNKISKREYKRIFGMDSYKYY